MKRILLSFGVMMALVGSACAVPSANDRKALCEKQSDKFIWVEKTQACIPINPCLSDVQEIKNAYCVNLPVLPDTMAGQLLIINNYVKHVLKTDIDSGVRVQDADLEAGSIGYVGFKTKDGGYIAAAYGSKELYTDDYDKRGYLAIIWGFESYGYPKDQLSFDDKSISHAVADEYECYGIVDTASGLSGINLKEKYQSGVCTVSYTGEIGF